MPRGDRTGPQGRGSMTGRGLGSCTENDNREFGFGGGGRGRGFFNNSRGLGGGRGVGQGNGYRGRFQNQRDNDDMGQNTTQASNQEQLDINKRLTEVIDQLSKLIKQSPEIRGSNAEKQ